MTPTGSRSPGGLCLRARESGLRLLGAASPAARAVAAGRTAGEARALGGAALGKPGLEGTDYSPEEAGRVLPASRGEAKMDGNSMFF